MIYRLTIYNDTGGTLVQVSTDASHPKPWLMLPQDYAASEVNFASGSASIGEMHLQVLDPEDPTGLSQDERLFTEILSDASGRSALSGRKAVVQDSRNGTTFNTIFAGVISRVELSDDLSSFHIHIRDTRENERDVALFTYTETPSALPMGVVDGYGKPYDGAPESDWLIPPTAPLRGTVVAGTGGVYVDLRDEYWLTGDPTAGRRGTVRQEVVISEKVTEIADVRGSWLGPLFSPRAPLSVLWRNVGGGSYLEAKIIYGLEANWQGNPLQPPAFIPAIAWAFAKLGDSEGPEVRAAYYVSIPDAEGQPIPTAGADVEIIVRYRGPVNKDWPLHVEGISAGQFLKNAYDGVYNQPRQTFFGPEPIVPLEVEYDETALLALTQPVRLRIDEPAQDAREWLEQNIYTVAGAAPAIRGGELFPVGYEIPPATVAVTELGTAECDVVAGWSQEASDAVNVVRVTYQRDLAVPLGDVDISDAGGDRLISREIVVEHRVPESIAILGEKSVEIKTLALRAIAGEEGQPYSGDIADEAGAQVAERIARMMTDRFALGGQSIILHADRSVPAVESLGVGDWVMVAVPWIPQYQAQTRGGNRFGQIIARRDVSPIRTELLIIDAGPDAQALATPTLGTLSQDGDGRVIVPVASIPTGGECRVDYAISSTQPTASSGLWTFAGRRDTPGNILTPEMPSGRTVWIRARTEAVGRRPSAYTTPVSISITAVPRVRSVYVYPVGENVEVGWTPNASTAGVRIYYQIHLDTVEPDFGEETPVDVAASAGVYTFTGLTSDRPPGTVFSVIVEPYPTFGGGSVSGTPGVGVHGSAYIGAPLDVPFGYVIAFRSGVDLEFVAQGNQLAAGGRWAVRIGDPPEEPDDPLADITGDFEGPFTFEQLTLSQDPDYDDVWVGVWFYDTYDYQPDGLRGPRVLARALSQPLAGTLQPDLNVRVEYDEDSDGPIARVIATVTDPFSRARPVDPMLAFVAPGPIDEIPPLGDVLYLPQAIETSGPYDGSYVWEVALDEKHLSVAALAFYWLDADSTERVISQVLWLDVGDDANIVFVTVSYDDRTATVTVKGDADTDELYAEESDDGDPDGTWYSVVSPTPSFTGDRFSTDRRGSFSVQTRTDRERFFRVYGRNFVGRDGPYEYFAVNRFQDPGAVSTDVRIQTVSWLPDTGESGGTTIIDPTGGQNRIALWTAQFSDQVQSYKVLVGPATAPVGSPVEANYYVALTGPSLESDFIRNLNTGGELGAQDAIQFPGGYGVDTVVQIIAYDNATATDPSIGSDSFLLRDEDPLNLSYYVDGSTVVEGQALRAGGNISIDLVDGLPEIAVDETGLFSSTALTVPQGGTGLDTLTSGAVIIGAGIDPPTFITPGDNGQVLTVSAGAWVAGDITGAVTNVTAGDGLSGGGSGSISLAVNEYQGLVANRGKTALEITSGTTKALAVVLGTASDEAAPGNHSITSHPETGLTAGHVLRATSSTAYSFGAIPAHDHLLGDIKDAGDGTGSGRLVVATSSGANTIAGPSAAGQVLKAVTTGTSATYEWGEVTTGVTSISAGDALDGGGAGAVTLNVKPYVGTGAGYGQTSIQSDSLAVVLGTTGNTAAAGNHGHLINDVTDATTVGQNLVKLTNPSAVRFIRINENNTVTALTAAQFKTAIGADEVTLANVKGAGDGTGSGRLVVGTASGANTIPAPSAAGQVLKALTTGTSATYEWGEATGGVTSVTAGAGLGGGGTGAVTIDVNPYVGTGAGYGQTEIVSDSVAVVLGTTGNTAAAGNHTHVANDISNATTVGRNLITLGNPSAIRFLRVNADNTVSALTAADFRTAIGAGTGSGTVTSVGGTGNVAGITLSGTVTSSGNLTLGGSLSVNLGTMVTGTLPIANGGTNATTASAARTNLGAGTVNSVSGTGSVAGLTLSGTVTNTGNLTLGGSLSVNLGTMVTGTLPIANGGTNATNATTARSNLGAGTVNSVSGGSGLTGTVTNTGSIDMGTPSTLTATSTNATTSTSHTHALDGSIADVRVQTSTPAAPTRAGALWFVV